MTTTLRIRSSAPFAFEWFDGKAPAGCELGLAFDARRAQADWVLVFSTPSGNLGALYDGLAARLVAARWK